MQKVKLQVLFLNFIILLIILVLLITIVIVCKASEAPRECLGFFGSSDDFLMSSSALEILELLLLLFMI